MTSDWMQKHCSARLGGRVHMGWEGVPSYKKSNIWFSGIVFEDTHEYIQFQIWAMRGLSETRISTCVAMAEKQVSSVQRWFVRQFSEGFQQGVICVKEMFRNWVLVIGSALFAISQFARFAKYTNEYFCKNISTDDRSFFSWYICRARVSCHKSKIIIIITIIIIIIKTIIIINIIIIIIIMIIIRSSASPGRGKSCHNPHIPHRCNPLSLSVWGSWRWP